MVVTERVSRSMTLSPLPQLIVARLVHAANMSNIVVTFAVLKVDRLRLVKLEQPENMACMFHTLAVLKFSGKERDVRFVQPWNMPCIVVTCSVLNVEGKAIIPNCEQP